jgi:hypothetical protein
MSESNLHILPPEISEYSKLCHEKKLLNERLCTINRRLKQLNPDIITTMQTKDLDIFEISPSKEEESEFGAMGAIQLKMKNEYDRLNRDNLIVYAIQFFKYLMPDDNEEDITKLGRGAGNWIWNNRGRKPKYYLERVYIDSKTPERAKKRKAKTENENDAEDQPKVKKPRKKANEPEPDIPGTREEFLSIPGFQKLLTGPSEEDVDQS